MKKEINHTFTFTQSPGEIWEYLTNPELIELWLMKSDFKAELGHRFRFMGGCNHEGQESVEAAYCEVLEIEPNSRLVYSWQTHSLADGKPYTSTVTWTLVPKQNGTDLHLLHNGFVVMEDLLAHNDGWTSIGKKIAEQLNAVSYECSNA
jgi:uncharacterized protein YndB with AHSA1/START domain